MANGRLKHHRDMVTHKAEDSDSYSFITFDQQCNRVQYATTGNYEIKLRDIKVST